MSDGKLLILADESPEFPAAALYAGLHAKAIGAGVLMLRVVEPMEFAHWSSVEQEMRREAHEAARALTERFVADIEAESGVRAQVAIRQGETRAELKRLIDEEATIRAIVLAAAAGREGPGPLVSSLAKGHGLATRPLPVIVVPGALAREEIRALAGPPEPPQKP